MGVNRWIGSSGVFVGVPCGWVMWCPGFLVVQCMKAIESYRIIHPITPNPVRFCRYLQGGGDESEWGPTAWARHTTDLLKGFHECANAMSGAFSPAREALAGSSCK